MGVNPLKKDNLWQKSFLDKVEWSSEKLQKKISNVKADVKQQEIKDLVTTIQNVQILKWNQNIWWKPSLS